ncbi:MAG: DUF1674 domain-containing protein [Pseudomonadota bacterium]
MAETSDKDRQKRVNEAAERALAEAELRRQNATPKIMAPEFDGVDGPEPTRFDDWEKKGITSDF